MKQFHIAEIVTKDKLVHQGIYFAAKRKSKVAILWVHGLTDNFYGDHQLLEALTSKCERQSWGLAAFNTRGHDIVTSITKLDKSTPKGYTHYTAGAGIEEFTDCVLDIEAGVTFLEKQGFSEVILVGSSTGANKVCYFAGTQKDKRVAGVILASPISDVAIKIKELGNKYQSVIKKAQALVKAGKGDALVEGFDYMPLTPKRFLSLYQENSAEDVFPYYQKNPKFAILAKIKKPLMVVMGAADEYSDRPVPEIIKILKKHQRSKNFRAVIVPRAFHSFGGKEKEFIREVANWIKMI